MRAKVTAEGVLIPRELLGDAEEVEITGDGRAITVAPSGTRDPLLGLGEKPVVCGIRDASEEHDKYLVDAGR